MGKDVGQDITREEDFSGVQQMGWNCFDVAVGVPRSDIVRYALKNKDNEEYRELLAPEIKHAMALTVVHMNSEEDIDEEDIGNEWLKRRIDKIFRFSVKLSEEDEEVREDAIEEVLRAMEAEENKSRKIRDHMLPKSMQTQALREIFEGYMNAHEDIQGAVINCNEKIGRQEGQRLSLEELDTFFSNEENREKNLQAYTDYMEARNTIFKGREQAFNDYARSQAVYEQYVQEYYGGRGWFAFQRGFTGESRNTSMIDIVAKMLEREIVVYHFDQPIYITHQHDGAAWIEVNYNGHNHFTQRKSESEDKEGADKKRYSTEITQDTQSAVTRVDDVEIKDDVSQLLSFYVMNYPEEVGLLILPMSVLPRIKEVLTERLKLFSQKRRNLFKEDKLTPSKMIVLIKDGKFSHVLLIGYRSLDHFRSADEEKAEEEMGTCLNLPERVYYMHSPATEARSELRSTMSAMQRTSSSGEEEDVYLCPLISEDNDVNFVERVRSFIFSDYLSFDGSINLAVEDIDQVRERQQFILQDIRHVPQDFSAEAVQAAQDGNLPLLQILIGSGMPFEEGQYHSAIQLETREYVIKLITMETEISFLDNQGKELSLRFGQPAIKLVWERLNKRMKKILLLERDCALRRFEKDFLGNQRRLCNHTTKRLVTVKCFPELVEVAMQVLKRRLESTLNAVLFQGKEGQMVSNGLLGQLAFQQGKREKQHHEYKYGEEKAGRGGFRTYLISEEEKAMEQYQQKKKRFIELQRTDPFKLPESLRGIPVEEPNNPMLMELWGANLSPNLRDAEGNDTLLHIAAARGDYPMAKFLCEEGADKTTENRKGWTPWMTARDLGNRKMFDLLRPEGVALYDRVKLSLMIEVYSEENRVFSSQTEQREGLFEDAKRAVVVGNGPALRLLLDRMEVLKEEYKKSLYQLSHFFFLRKKLCIKIMLFTSLLDILEMVRTGQKIEGDCSEKVTYSAIKRIEERIDASVEEEQRTLSLVSEMFDRYTDLKESHRYKIMKEEWKLLIKTVAEQLEESSSLIGGSFWDLISAEGAKVTELLDNLRERKQESEEGLCQITEQIFSFFTLAEGLRRKIQNEGGRDEERRRKLLTRSYPKKVQEYKLTESGGWQAFLEAGVSVNAKDKKGDTLLHMACENDQLEIMQMLIEEYGASPVIPDAKGKTVLRLVIPDAQNGTAEKYDVFQAVMRFYQKGRGVERESRLVDLTLPAGLEGERSLLKQVLQTINDYSKNVCNLPYPKKKKTSIFVSSVRHCFSERLLLIERLLTGFSESLNTCGIDSKKECELYKFAVQLQKELKDLSSRKPRWFMSQGERCSYDFYRVGQRWMKDGGERKLIEDRARCQFFVSQRKEYLSHFFWFQKGLEQRKEGADEKADRAMDVSVQTQEELARERKEREAKLGETKAELGETKAELGETKERLKKLEEQVRFFMNQQKGSPSSVGTGEKESLRGEEKEGGSSRPGCTRVE